MISFKMEKMNASKILMTQPALDQGFVQSDYVNNENVPPPNTTCLCKNEQVA